MVRVKVIKIDERHEEYATQEEKDRVGEIFEAFVINDEYQQDERYKTQYALNLHKYVWFVPADCCEVVEEKPTMKEFKELLKTGQYEVIPPEHRILLVEDGSVDTEHLEKLGINYIIYRSGANKPEWL